MTIGRGGGAKRIFHQGRSYGQARRSGEHKGVELMQSHDQGAVRSVVSSDQSKENQLGSQERFGDCKKKCETCRSSGKVTTFKNLARDPPKINHHQAINTRHETVAILHPGFASLSFRNQLPVAQGPGVATPISGVRDAHPGTPEDHQDRV